MFLSLIISQGNPEVQASGHVGLATQTQHQRIQPISSEHPIQEIPLRTEIQLGGSRTNYNANVQRQPPTTKQRRRPDIPQTEGGKFAIAQSVGGIPVNGKSPVDCSDNSHQPVPVEVANNNSRLLCNEGKLLGSDGKDGNNRVGDFDPASAVVDVVVKPEDRIVVF